MALFMLLTTAVAFAASLVDASGSNNGFPSSVSHSAPRNLQSITKRRRGLFRVATNRALATAAGGPETTVGSCFDSDVGAVYLNVTFYNNDAADEANTQGPLNWLGLAFREDQECLMTPRGGADGEFILVTTDNSNDGLPNAVYGPLPAAVRSSQTTIIEQTLAELTPLSSASGFTDVEVSRTGGSVTLSFKRTMATTSTGLTPPAVMHLTYAYGLSPTFGFHSSAGCFDVNEFPPCSTVGVTSTTITSTGNGSSDSEDDMENETEEDHGKHETEDDSSSETFDGNDSSSSKDDNGRSGTGDDNSNSSSEDAEGSGTGADSASSRTEAYYNGQDSGSRNSAVAGFSSIANTLVITSAVAIWVALV